jgi:tetratricopeptide (TPR) repeat protein
MKKTLFFSAVMVVTAGVALYSQPYDSDFYIGRAYEYSIQGNSAKELENLNDALRVDPDNIRALSMRGTNYARNGDYARAKVDFDRAHSLAPYSAETQHNLDYLNSLTGLYQPERIGNLYSSEVPAAAISDATEYPPPSSYGSSDSSVVVPQTRRSDVELYYEEYSAAPRYLNTRDYVPAGTIYDHSKGQTPGPDPVSGGPSTVNQPGTAIMERANPPPPPTSYTIYPSPDAYPPGTPTGRGTVSASPPPAYSNVPAAPQTVYTETLPARSNPSDWTNSPPASVQPAYTGQMPAVAPATTPSVYSNRGGVVYDSRPKPVTPKPLPAPDAANSLRIDMNALRSQTPSPVRIVSNQNQISGRDMIKQVAVENTKMNITEAVAAINNAGVKLAHAARFDQAIAEFSTAIGYSPQFAIAYNNRGVAYACKGEFEKALADFNNALRLNPYYFDAQANREEIKMTIASR